MNSHSLTQKVDVLRKIEEILGEQVIVTGGTALVLFGLVDSCPEGQVEIIIYGPKKETVDYLGKVHQLTATCPSGAPLFDTGTYTLVVDGITVDVTLADKGWRRKDVEIDLGYAKLRLDNPGNVIETALDNPSERNANYLGDLFRKVIAYSMKRTTVQSPVEYHCQKSKAEDDIDTQSTKPSPKRPSH